MLQLNYQKQNVQQNPLNTDMLLCADHLVTRKSRMSTSEKVTAKALYTASINMVGYTPSPQI